MTKKNLRRLLVLGALVAAITAPMGAAANAQDFDWETVTATTGADVHPVATPGDELVTPLDFDWE